MRFDAVSADAHDNGVGLRDRLNSVAEPARFFGSTRRIVLGIEPQNHSFPAIIGKRVLLAVAPRQRERRRFLSFQTCHADLLEVGIVAFAYHTAGALIKLNNRSSADMKKRKRFLAWTE